MKRTLYGIIVLLCTLGLFPACEKHNPTTSPSRQQPQSQKQQKVVEAETADNDEWYYVNYFGYNVMSLYYLWDKEIDAGLGSWKYTDDPIKKVSSVRYKDSDGKDIDRWTEMTDKFSELNSSMQGTNTTYGADIEIYYYDSTSDLICAVVRFVYAGSPAEKAGLKRGDVITSVNGQTLRKNNYYNLVVNDFIYSASCTIGLESGKSIKMNAVTMYEDPVLLSKTFGCNGKKVGYLLYTSFTPDSGTKLIEICKKFKAEGVSELILDLRYNGGGYVMTEFTLASMLAPAADVKASSVYEKEIYNAGLTEYYQQQGISTDRVFSSEFEDTMDGKSYKYSTADANIGINKIYALVSSGTASASESLLVGLKPYMDIVIIGEQTHGKYCSGILYSAHDWYEDYKDTLSNDFYTNGITYSKDWGMYLMISRYADKNGETPCMPDGFKPDVEIADRPFETYPLGDDREALLREALKLAGKTDLTPMPDTKASSARAYRLKSADRQPQRPEFGLRILPEKPVAPHRISKPVS